VCSRRYLTLKTATSAKLSSTNLYKILPPERTFMGCGSSRPEPEATPTGSSAPRPRPHISAPLEVDPYQPGASFAARSAPVQVTLPTNISKSLNIGPDLKIQVTQPGNPNIARRAPVKAGHLPPTSDYTLHSDSPFVNRKPVVSRLHLQCDRPHHNPNSRYSTVVSPVDESFPNPLYDPNSKFDVSPVEEKFPKYR
jgi:hypothetical protein